MSRPAKSAMFPAPAPRMSKTPRLFPPANTGSIPPRRRTTKPFGSIGWRRKPAAPGFTPTIAGLKSNELRSLQVRPPDRHAAAGIFPVGRRLDDDAFIGGRDDQGDCGLRRAGGEPGTGGGRAQCSPGDNRDATALHRLL